MRSMQIESVLQTKNRSELAKNRFSVALLTTRVDPTGRPVPTTWPILHLDPVI